MEGVLDRTLKCVLHDQTLDKHFVTQYGITRHLKLCNGCCLSKSVT